MTPSQQFRLQDVLERIKHRYGQRALRRIRDITHPLQRTISTTHPSLDAAIGRGGLPRAAVSELCGETTSGATTLALQMLAFAQETGGSVAYLDCAHTFDPAYASRHNIDLEKLLLIQPTTGEMALDIAQQIASSDQLRLLVIDSVPTLIKQTNGSYVLGLGARRLALALRRTQTAALFLNTPRWQHALAHCAAVRVQVSRQQWLRSGNDVTGCQVRATVTKSRAGQAGGAAILDILFRPKTAATDTTW